jgi:hypothetical protein
LMPSLRLPISPCSALRSPQRITLSLYSAEE